MNMVTLEDHIDIFKELRIIGKNNLIRMIWHIATEHSEEITCEDFIKKTNPPRIVEQVGR